MSKEYDLTPHEMHKLLIKNGYQPTVTDDDVNDWLALLRHDLFRVANLALAEGKDRYLILRFDGILGDITSGVTNADGMRPDVVEFLTHPDMAS